MKGCLFENTGIAVMKVIPQGGELTPLFLYITHDSGLSSNKYEAFKFESIEELNHVVSFMLENKGLYTNGDLEFAVHAIGGDTEMHSMLNELETI